MSELQTTPSPEIRLKENISKKPETMTKIFWEKFSKNKLAILGAVILFIIIMSAVFAPLIAPYPQEQQSLLDKYKAPGLEHLMGTDKFGRDIFSRILYGARVSLLVGFASVVGSILIGTVLGALAGYFRGIVDAVIMRVVDIVLSIPDIFLLITLVTIFKPGVDKLILIFCLTGWTTTARLVRENSCRSVQGNMFLLLKQLEQKRTKLFFSYPAQCVRADYRVSYAESWVCYSS